MDKMLYVAMSGAKQNMLAQNIHQNNLANINTAGFRADLANARSAQLTGSGLPTRAFNITESNSFDTKEGSKMTTGRELDVSVNGQGWIAVQSPDGREAYTRAGNFRFLSGGQLVTGSNHPVLGNGAPIAIPPSEKIDIGVDGTISVRPTGQAANALATIDRIKLVNPNPQEMYRGEDGLFYMRNGQAEADANVTITSGALEGSNVSAIEEMVDLISAAREFELDIKMMKSAEENETSADELMKIS